MKVLFVLPDLYEAPKGGPELTRREIVSYMASRHDCDAAVINRREGGGTARFLGSVGVDLYDKLLYDGSYRRLFVDLLSVVHLGRPLSCPRDNKLGRFIQGVLDSVDKETYDVIHLDNPALAPLAPLLSPSSLAYFLMDAPSLRHQALARESKNPVSRAYQLGISMVGRYVERLAAENADFVGFASFEESAELESRFQKGNIGATGIPVPEKFFTLGSETNDSQNTQILILGDMTVFYIREAVLRFMAKVWPQIDRIHDGVDLMILGRGADNVLAERLPRSGNVRWKSWVEDYAETVRGADIVIVPDLAGSGVKNRVLQAMALGKPVVGSQDAWRGIPYENGVPGMMASSHEEYVEKLSLLLADEDRRTKLGEAGRRVAREKFSPEAIGEEWEKIYHHISGT